MCIYFALVGTRHFTGVHTKMYVSKSKLGKSSNNDNKKVLFWKSIACRRKAKLKIHSNKKEVAARKTTWYYLTYWHWMKINEKTLLRASFDSRAIGPVQFHQFSKISACAATTVKMCYRKYHKLQPIFTLFVSTWCQAHKTMAYGATCIEERKLNNNK